LAQVTAKPLGWVMQYVHPIVNRFHKHKSATKHTGLYEHSDILKLLSNQQKQQDNRIEDFELELLKHVVEFGHINVSDIMTPKRKVHSIDINEILGPIVLSELHKTRHSYFPVYDGKTTNVVGILSLVTLAGLKTTINVTEVMSQTIYYVHEEQMLGELLQVMIKTSQELFVVINSNQEYVGIVTAREVLKKLVGKDITNEFDSYDNRELVANRFIVESENENKSPEESTEVIE
jgi:CBS domain containing-hemolysin-like protein